jgi:hypothetical protein
MREVGAAVSGLSVEQALGASSSPAVDRQLASARDVATRLGVRVNARVRGCTDRGSASPDSCHESRGKGTTTHTRPPARAVTDRRLR